MIVSFRDFELEPRFDYTPWITLKIEESQHQDGPWALIDSQPILPVDHDPAHPIRRNFTTDNATLSNGWYKVSFWDATNNHIDTEPIYNAPSLEILASLEDINANLDQQIAVADSENTQYVQLSVARVVRGYLSRVLPNATLMSWDTPAHTPELIREAAAKLIAAQIYLNQASTTSTTVEPNSFGQTRYNEGMAILNGIIAGKLIIPDVPLVTPVEGMTDLDFFPRDATDRAFTLGLRLD